MRIGERNARDVAGRGFTDRYRRCARPRQHRIGRRRGAASAGSERFVMFGTRRKQDSQQSYLLLRRGWDVAVVADGCCRAIFSEQVASGPNCLLPFCAECPVVAGFHQARLVTAARALPVTASTAKLRLVMRPTLARLEHRLRQTAPRRCRDEHAARPQIARERRLRRDRRARS